MSRHANGRLGMWAAGIAGPCSEERDILSGVPGPMCPKIDAAKSGGRWGLTKPKKSSANSCAECGDHYTVDDYEELWSDVQEVLAERDRAHEGLEECRTALDALRRALTDALEMARRYREETHELRDKVRKLQAEP